MSNEMTHTKVLIIGTGPAGYTAAIYSSRANLSPIVVEGIQPGGQLTTTTDIENFPGFPDAISGTELMDRMKKQGERFGAAFVSGEVTDIDLSKRPFIAQINHGERVIEAETVIIATGASAKYLGLPDETKYAGRASLLAPPATASSTAASRSLSSAAETPPARKPPTSPPSARRSI